MFSEYGELSSLVYEHTKPVGLSLDGDLEYYEQQLESVTGRILEAGVGTGRLLIPYLQKGLLVDGVDLSSDMLAHCRTNCQQAGVTAQLYQQNLESLSLEHRYEAIIMPTGSFALLSRPKGARKALEAFYEHLLSGGRLLLDLALPTDFSEGTVQTNFFPIAEEQGILFTSRALTMDWRNQRTSYLNRYELWEKNTLLKTEIAEFTLYWYGILEFELLLEQIGFREIQHTWNYGHHNTGDLVTFHATK